MAGTVADHDGEGKPYQALFTAESLGIKEKP